MLISHNWLQSYFKNPEKLPAPKDIADLFTMHAFEIESLEEKDGDYIYDIKITPDRGPYAYGLRYVALELSLIIPELEISDGIRFDISEKDMNQVATKVNAALVDASLKESCPVYSLTRIDNIKNIESPDFIKKSLTAIGQNPKSLLVDLTNFVMFDVGQPLHVFDADKVEGQIHVALSKEGETITILGGKEIKLEAGTLVIRDSKDILAIAGVKGGIKAEVDSNTKNVYLESANFNQTTVRKTARSLNLLNDSSKRFEQGLNKERFLIGVQDYLHLLSWYDKEIVIHETEVSDELQNIISPANKTTIDINIDKLATMVDSNDQGVPTRLVDFVEHILPKTGAEVRKRDEKNYTIIAPYHRSDMQLDVDIADEFLRNKNYDSLAYDEHFKDGVQASAGLKSPSDKLSYALRSFFQDKGFNEVLLHTLVDSKENADATVLENSLTADRDSLQSDLKNNIVPSIENNFKSFEIGKVFESKGDDVVEKTHLAFGLGMVKWPKDKKAEDAMSEIVTALGLDNAKVETINNIIICEIDFDDIDAAKVPEGGIENYQSPDALIKTRKYKIASTYPAMSRDIAFFVEDSLGKSEDDIANLIKAEVAKQPLIENHFRFDIFKKEGKTSYAYRFVFQSYEKTLTEDETKAVMNTISDNLTKEGFEIR
jgi:phenylalanyl-tRNA synthetase beta chain